MPRVGGASGGDRSFHHGPDVFYAAPMEPTALTVVSQLIVDAQTRHGAAALRRLDVAPDLLDDSMDQVLALGGAVGLDWCMVDGVEVGGLPADDDAHGGVAIAWLHGDDDPHPLVPLDD